MTRAFYIPNHSASDLHSAEVHDLPTLSKRPDFATKDDFVKWCHDLSTDHVFYTLYEPEQPALRSSAENPIRLMHGLVADYDGAASAINAALPTLKFAAGLAPAWVTTTFSGRARLIWMFERPVPVFSGEVLARVLRSMAKELGMTKILPGLDEGFFTNPATPYELGTNWRQPFGDQRIPATMVMTHVHDASNRVKWKSDTVDIPMEAIEAEVNKRWPGRWSGPLVEGARGIRFWDPKADNLTGVTIRAQGVQAWTGEGKFLPWSEVLGNEFVKKYRQSRIGGAIDGIYYDGQMYWQRDDSGNWSAFNGPQISRRMSVMFGLSAEAKKGQSSEVAQAITSVENCKRVDGAFPCLFVKEEVVRDGTQSYLNIGRAKCLEGTGQKREWGDGFPWLASYFNGLFDEKQLGVFLSWYSHFFNNARVGKPKRGQALFICGPASAGKTLLSQKIIGASVGGFQEATRYILGETSFNEQLFYAPVWAVDDATAGTDSKKYALYSQMVKKFVANPSQEFHPKFKKAVTHKFNGRLITTLNDDPQSQAMFPQVEGTLLDKIVALIARSPGVSFCGCEEKIDTELPYFLDYLSHWVLPDWLATKPEEVSRFGMDAWHNPELLSAARDVSASAGLFEVLERWRVLYFRRFSDKAEWRGNVSDLIHEFGATEGFGQFVRMIAPSRMILARDLQQLTRQGINWITYGRSASARYYTITNPNPVKK